MVMRAVKMKRLYVRPEGTWICFKVIVFIESIMDHAKDSGYTEMVLDTMRTIEGSYSFIQETRFY